MEISNKINSVIVDIDKLTFKKDDGANSFIIDLQPNIESVTSANVLSSSVPIQSSDSYLTGLPSTNKSILTKISNIDIYLKAILVLHIFKFFRINIISSNQVIPKKSL